MFITVCQNAIENVNSNNNYILSYYYGDWLQYSNHLSNENKKKSTERRRFPGAFLITEYDEEVDERKKESYISGLTIVLSNKTEKTNNKDRYDDEISELKKIMDTFIEELRSLTVDFRYSFETKFNAELDTNNITNQLRLNIRDLTFDNYECSI